MGLTFIDHKKTFDNATDNDLIQLDTWLKSNKTNCMLISTKQKYSYLRNRNEDLYLTVRNKELEVIQKINTLV